MSKKFYKLINNAQELKTLHDEATLHGKLEVGLSKGKLLYVWDEERNNIRSIKAEEAAARLGLTIKQIDQIIVTNAEVVFEDPKEIIEAKKEVTFQEEVTTVVDTTREVAEEAATEEPVEEPIEEQPIQVELDAPESTQEEQQAQPKEVKDVNEPLLALIEDAIAATEKFKTSINN